MRRAARFVHEWATLAVCWALVLAVTSLLLVFYLALAALIPGVVASLIRENVKGLRRFTADLRRVFRNQSPTTEGDEWI